MLRALALAIAVLGMSSAVSSGEAPGDDVANYEIQATLDPGKKSVTATARITWTNPSADAVPDLWFHLYLNAFRDRDSTFWRESRGQLRGVTMPENGWGSIEISALRLADSGTDLLPALSYEAPDDGNAKDRTVARVVLPRPAAPGERVALDVAFTAKLPKAYARTGYAGDYYLVGQWFPKLAVYEPAGRRGRTSGGWNAHQFHADSEFYADFGRYRVSITAPSTFIVGATGVRTGQSTSGANTTYTYEQDRIHDFAWTASPRFVDITRRFVAAREVSEREYRDAAARLDRPIDQLRLGDVDVRLLVQPEHQPQAERYLQAAMRGLKAFGLAYGAYPYRTLTIVDPPEDAQGTGGMEYPTFFTAGTVTLFNAWPFDRIREPEDVVVHELAHQYFQGLVASNEFEEAWLDEGVTTYVTAQVMDGMFGPERSTAELAGLRFSQGDQFRTTNHRDRGAEMIRQPSWTYDEGYGFNAYFRPALTLRTLERLVGERTMARILRAYVERWRYRHPSSDDFYAVASEVAGRDLRPFFTQTIESPAVVDYELGTIETGRGSTTVTARRYGDLQMPVDVAFKFEGRPVERRRWDGAARTARFTFTYDERLEWADVDPDRTVVLDVSWLNNGRRVAPDRRAPAAMTSRWLLTLQQVLGWLAF